MLIRLLFFLGTPLPHRYYAPSSCPKSSPSLSVRTCSPRHTQIRDAVHSSAYLPTRLCPSVNLDPDPLPKENTWAPPTTRRFSRACPPRTAPGLRPQAPWIGILRFLHFLDLVLGFQVPLTGKCPGSRALGSLGRHGQQVELHQCLGASETSRDQLLKVEFPTPI